MDLSAIPIYDHHAHALYPEALWRTEPIEQYFTEAYDPEILKRFVQDNLFFRRSIRDLAGFYGCDPTPEAVLETRQKHDYIQLCRSFFAEANITRWLIDDGIWVDRLWSIEECKQNVGIPTERVVRLEVELAKLVEKHDTATKLLSDFERKLHEIAPEVISFKSIVAYRTGLNITHHHLVELERSYSEMRKALHPGQTPRIASKPILDSMLWVAFKVAVQHNKPVQFHSGYGDPDLDMRLANPLHLRDVLETPELKGLKVVFLHCYPYMREAGYLASVYPGAYMDLGLTIPYASVQGMLTAVQESLHLSPISKVLFSSDAQRTPELFWLAARWGRRILGQVLDQTIQNGDLTADEAHWAAQRILHDNSAELYGV